MWDPWFCAYRQGLFWGLSVPQPAHLLPAQCFSRRETQVPGALRCGSIPPEHFRYQNLGQKGKIVLLLQISCKSSSCGVKLGAENVFPSLELLRAGGVPFTLKVSRSQSDC